MINNKLTEINTIETTLLEKHSVDECVVQMRYTNDAEQQIITFVVSNSPPAPECLYTHLQTKLMVELLSSAYVPLSNLPLTAEGQFESLWPNWKMALATRQPVDSIDNSVNFSPKSTPKQLTTDISFIVDDNKQIVSKGAKNRLQIKGISVTSGNYQNPLISGVKIESC